MTIRSRKKPTKVYWILTGLAGVFMLMASIPDVLRVPQAAAIFMHLGYPQYLLPFLGVAKALGVAAVLVPGVRRLKEWAYAGLIFDLIGAFYSHLSVGDPASALVPPIIGSLLVTGSYVSYRLLVDEPALDVSVPAGQPQTGHPAG